MNGYRKELKFIVDDTVLKDVDNRICCLLHKDEHQQGDHYDIRSIYFDSPSLKCFEENEAGVSTREKYRIRIYNRSDKQINAEVKIRHRDTISKMSAPISRQILDAITDGDFADAAGMLTELKREYEDKQLISEKYGMQFADRLTKDCSVRTIEKYIMKLLGENYRPKVIVGYERCAYVYDMCNVRITFDRNVGGTRAIGRFFDEDLMAVPAIDDNKHVLEIKYDEFLPDEIASVLAGMNLERNSCSKYAKCMIATDSLF